MRYDPSDIVRELIALRKRVSEITARIRRETDLLTDAYQELGDLFAAAVAAQAKRSSPAAPAAASLTWSTSSSHVDAGPPSTRLIRIDAVRARVGLSRSSIWRMVKDDKFPKPRRLSTRAVAWLEADVSDWVRARSVFGESGQPPRARRRL